MEEVDTECPSYSPPHSHPFLSMRRTPKEGPSYAKPSPNNMPVSDPDIREMQTLLWARAEGIERRARLDYLKKTWKSSIWSDEDDEEYTLPDPVVPLVYSLNYTQQCHQQWDDNELPTETVSRLKKQELGNSNLHAEEDFSQKLESRNLVVNSLLVTLLGTV